MHQDDLDRQTAYLRTLRDATRTQMQKFLEGMLFHVAEEYGRAHPVAAQAAEADRAHSGAAELPEGDIDDITAESLEQEVRAESPNGFASVAPGL
jgi:hypothetical protein